MDVRVERVEGKPKLETKRSGENNKWTQSKFPCKVDQRFFFKKKGGWKDMTRAFHETGRHIKEGTARGKGTTKKTKKVRNRD